jgi:hypothetical protein
MPENKPHHAAVSNKATSIKFPSDPAKENAQVAHSPQRVAMLIYRPIMVPL